MQSHEDSNRIGNAGKKNPIAEEGPRGTANAAGFRGIRKPAGGKKKKSKKRINGLGSGKKIQVAKRVDIQVKVSYEKKTFTTPKSHRPSRAETEKGETTKKKEEPIPAAESPKNG